MSTTVASVGDIRPLIAWPSVIRPEAVYANARELCTYALEPELGEPGTLRYDWYRSDDAGVFIVIEEYTGSEVALTHNEHCGGLLGRMATVAEVVSAHIHGRLSPELEAWVAEHPFAHSHAPLDYGRQPPPT